MTNLSALDRVSVERARRDPDYRRLLLVKAGDALLAGDPPIAKACLRDYINATLGFAELAAATGGNSKSLMRMLSDGGNPTLANVAVLLAQLQAHEGLTMRVARTAEPAAA